MSRFILSPRAQADLYGIWVHCRNVGRRQAERYVRLIAEAINVIAASPVCGKRCAHIREGYRKYPAGSHVLFYRPTGEGIDVVRILHQQIDFDRHF